MNPLSYRGDVEGLRAIAVLIVIFSHVGMPGFKGGFVGVDVFFIISGYLITKILVAEIEETSKLNILKFFARRLKRLLPALILMIAVVSLIAVVLLSPFEQVRQAFYAKSAVLWISNIRLAVSSFNYFEHISNENLFLHTWSLGVEGQFYLIFPVIIFLLFRWGKTTESKYYCLLLGLLIIFLISFLFCIYITNRNTLFGFYYLPSRIWQFSLGAMIVPLTHHYKNRLKSQNWLIWGGWIGFSAVFISTIIFNENTRYPSAWAIIPSAGSALVIFSGFVKHKNSIGIFLASIFFQRVGHVSYSLYLWHWPIIALGGLFFQNDSFSDKIVLIFAAAFISVITYFLVESPIRKNRTFGYVGTIFSSLVLTTILYGLVSQWHSSSYVWLNLPEQKVFSQIAKDLPIIYSQGCDDWYHSSQLKMCLAGDKNAKKTVVLVGDSVGVQWFPAVQSKYKKQDYKVVTMTKSSCPFIDAPFFYARIGREFTECSKWRLSAIEGIKKLNPEIVYIGSDIYQFEKQEFIDGTKKILDEITPFTQQIVIIRPTNGLPFDGLECLSRQRWQKRLIGSVSDCRAKTDNDANRKSYEWLVSISKEYNNVKILDMNDMVCPAGNCSAEMNGLVVYRDSKHLSAHFVESLSQSFDFNVEKIIGH